MPDGLDSSGLDLTAVRDFGTALLIGGLIGIEREKRPPAPGAIAAGSSAG